ncbi:MAG TPA: helix-turn-helix domain-containing protein [Verrucomicrobiae bacterium]|nr:helix-turn-helix domain-containing protein [Verrucomicrobiae bacterium]
MGKPVPQSRKDAFARLLKSWRERERLTQADAAARLGTNLYTIRNWEQGRSMPQGFAATLVRNIISAPSRRSR